MIDTKDLRRGNYIYKKRFPVDHEENIDSEIILVDGITRQSVATSDETQVGKEYLFPIPLTKEWMFNLGFDFEETFINSFSPMPGTYAKSYTLKLFPEFKIEFNGNIEYEVGIKYVHQLQNLVFVMTGQELIYNPKVKH